MRITTTELRAAAELLLAHLEKSGRGTLEVEQDFYWEIPPKERYDPYAQPQELSLGQLSDDWVEVSAIVRGEGQPVGYALVWLASLLRAVGENNVG